MQSVVSSSKVLLWSYSSSLQSISCYAAILYKLVFQSSRSNVCWVHTYNQNGKWTHSIIAGLCAASLSPQQASKHWNFCGAVDPFLPTLQGQDLVQCWWSWRLGICPKWIHFWFLMPIFHHHQKQGSLLTPLWILQSSKFNVQSLDNLALKNTVRFEA